MKANFEVEIETKTFKSKIVAKGNATLSNVVKEMNENEVSGRLDDLITAGILVHGELFVTEPKIRKDFFDKHNDFFQVDSIQFSKAKSCGENGAQYDLIAKNREK